MVEPGRARPTPVEQKLEQSISGRVAWNLAPPPNAAGPPTVTPQPLSVEERAADEFRVKQ